MTCSFDGPMAPERQWCFTSGGQGKEHFTLVEPGGDFFSQVDDEISNLVVGKQE